MFSNKLLSFIVLMPLISCEGDFCPNPTLVSPCVCRSNNIICDGDSSIDLPRLFTRLSHKLRRNERHFHSFNLTNTAITDLRENTFKDITFDEILINEANLKHIHRNAFSKNYCVTKKLLIWDSKLDEFTGDTDIYDELSRFVNARKMDILNTNITEIPDYAFEPLKQNNLRELAFRGNSIVKIGNYTFRSLNNLVWIHLGRLNITHIPVNAFRFKRRSNEMIKIKFFECLHISSDSFADGALTDIGRPVWLHLDRMTFISERIFLPFLMSDDRNRIEFQWESFDCSDCRNYWLKQKSLLTRIIDTKCADYKLLSDSSNFANC